MVNEKVTALRLSMVWRPPSKDSKGIPVKADDSIASRLKFLDFDQAHRATLREMRPLVNQILPGILDEFYAHIRRFPAMAGFVTSTEAKNSVKARQLKHWT